MELTFYTRDACHLCQQAKAKLLPLAQEFGIAFREVNVDTDSSLRARFNDQVPVFFLDGRKVGKHRVDIKEFRRMLERVTRRSHRR